MAGIVPESWSEWGLGAEGDLAPSPPQAGMLAARVILWEFAFQGYLASFGELQAIAFKSFGVNTANHFSRQQAGALAVDSVCNAPSCPSHAVTPIFKSACAQRVMY